MSSGPVAIVTGSGSGIGAAAASALSAAGFAVVLVGRRREPLAQTTAGFTGASLLVEADLADPGAPQLIVERTLERFERIDVLVNNAAVIRVGPLESVDRAMFDQHYAVNVAAPMFLLAAALPALRRSDSASVINISSSVGSMVKPGTMLYGSSKAALEYLTRAWAYELADAGVRVNCLAPGPVDTPIHATYAEDLDATYEDLARRIPLGRMGKVDDLASWVVFLASADSSWTTGAVIPVDGGQTLGLPEAAGG